VADCWEMWTRERRIDAVNILQNVNGPAAAMPNERGIMYMFKPNDKQNIAGSKRF